ncbi:MAG: excinuclease ABC subunit UvrA [Planctomycetota bacterium]
MPARDELTHLVVRGAREHNLRGIDVTIPKKALVVFTGVSGSGKTSLAFDTIYAEGNRRYVESLSAYARQFLGRMDKPAYETIRGLAPTIAIEQKTAGRNPRSTVGTITEIADYLRVLFARAGTPHCHRCGREVTRQSVAEMAADLDTLPAKTKVQVLAPVIIDRKGEHREVFRDLERQGLVRARLDGEVIALGPDAAADKKKKHTIEAVVDRLVKRDGWLTRLTDSLETALPIGKGVVTVVLERPGDAAEEKTYSERLACVPCGCSLPDLEPAAFSFNSPQGMCPACQGLGHRIAVDPALVVADPSATIAGGAIKPWASAMARGNGWVFRYVKAMAKAFKVPLTTPWSKLPKKTRDLVLYGTGAGELNVPWKEKKSEGVWRTTYRGIVNSIERRYLEAKTESAKKRWGPYMTESPCRDCDGTRLRPESRAVRVGGAGLAELTARTIGEAAAFFSGLELPGAKATIAAEVLREIGSRLRFLQDVGLEYLTLDRRGPTLSGGESQRIRLASQMGTELTGVIYVLDEPSIGLHARDTARLIVTLERLRDVGNTVIVVEHDTDTIDAADFIVDFGPGAGALGGQVVVAGPKSKVKKTKASLTGAYLSGTRRIELPGERRAPGSAKLGIRNATANNLRKVNVDVPLGRLVAVSGVSGAGKSTLVNQLLIPALREQLGGVEGEGNGNGDDPPVAAKGIRLTGVHHLDKCIVIDQRPIGRTPRSNPATYTKAFDPIRQTFAQMGEARAFGYTASRFSFNVKGGRCEACEGDGMRRIEMHFLPDVYVACEVCRGKRFNDATLRVLFKGRSIADVLAMTVDEAAELFASHPKVIRILETLQDVGVGYLGLGQPSTTLSGGEAQRIKLSRELAKRATGRTLYVLDEPTVGLHPEDIRKLLVVLQRLVDAGNTVLVIEHNLDVLKVADWIIDVGPEGGDAGGTIVAEGTPEAVAKVKTSHTGRALRAILRA